MRWDHQNLFVIPGFRYSEVRFHIFYCNSAGLSNVAPSYNGVFVIARFVIAGCHSTLILCIILITVQSRTKS